MRDEDNRMWMTMEGEEKEEDEEEEAMRITGCG